MLVKRVQDEDVESSDIVLLPAAVDLHQASSMLPLTRDPGRLGVMLDAVAVASAPVFTNDGKLLMLSSLG